MILRPEIDTNELAKIIKNDFEIDSHQADEINVNKLFDGLFALANTWVPTLEEHDYEEFFVALTLKINDSNT
jgi:hypothetical protein